MRTLTYLGPRRMEVQDAPLEVLHARPSGQGQIPRLPQLSVQLFGSSQLQVSTAHSPVE